MAHVPKRVCIAGAGPSGLVAAKTLLHYQLPQSSCSSAIAAGVPRSQTEGPFFTVTLYDTQPRIGGLWPSSRSDRNGLVHPDMVANQSRHTVQFSDLAWPGSGAFDDKPGPEFPAAWQVGRYLQGYRERYLDGQPAGGNDVALGRAHGAEFRLGWKVEKTTLLDNGRWVVTARKVVDGVGQPETETREFDYVIVSTGFFGRPAFPQSLPEEAAKKAAVPVIHSSAYRDLSSLGLEEGGPLPKGLSILVVGGQMSGVEIAATIASHLSAAANAPEPSKIPAIEKITVHHVIQRPTWVFPLFLRVGMVAGQPHADSC